MNYLGRKVQCGTTTIIVITICFVFLVFLYFSPPISLSIVLNSPCSAVIQILSQLHHLANHMVAMSGLLGYNHIIPLIAIQDIPAVATVALNGKAQHHSNSHCKSQLDHSFLHLHPQLCSGSS
eukprot:TRINITY_DN22215_c0_g1_i1.p1 TRINITY_DN22215_c0_g1~~TRINITY_DN22215_c0_g1_i1.p1  ORF type:complete len:123 (+),score=6.66 TRINITY_DN22215_c0_g1_i1:142-510(+)